MSPDIEMKSLLVALHPDEAELPPDEDVNEWVCDEHDLQQSVKPQVVSLYFTLGLSF